MHLARPPPASSDPPTPVLALGCQTLSLGGTYGEVGICPPGAGPLFPREGVDAQVTGPLYYYPVPVFLFCSVWKGGGQRTLWGTETEVTIGIGAQIVSAMWLWRGGHVGMPC